MFSYTLCRHREAGPRVARHQVASGSQQFGDPLSTRNPAHVRYDRRPQAQPDPDWYADDDGAVRYGVTRRFKT